MLSYENFDYNNSAKKRKWLNLSMRKVNVERLQSYAQNNHTIAYYGLMYILDVITYYGISSSLYHPQIEKRLGRIKPYFHDFPRIRASIRGSP